MTAVLGGGIGGLSAAYYLSKNIPKKAITLIEATNRVGGWIKTIKYTDDSIFEQGPRTIRPAGDAGLNTLMLIEELGLSDKIYPIRSSHPAAQNRMIYVNGELHKLPNSVMSMLKTLPPFSKPLVSALYHDIVTKSVKMQDESIYDFAKRRFGHEIADYLICPMICGICAGDAKEISVNFLMKSLFENEQKYGSVVKGQVYSMFKSKNKKPVINSKLASQMKSEKWSIYSFKGGLELLPKTMEKILCSNEVNIKLQNKCTEINFNTEKVSLNVNGEEILADSVISSILSKQLAPLIEKQHPELAANLKSIPSVDVGVVNLQFDKNALKYEAFGFLVPPSENIPVLGVIFDSCCFSIENSTILTVMMGGKWFEKLFGKNPKPELLLNTATEYVNKILHIDAQPISSNVGILRDCIPQYVVGHNDTVNRIESYIQKNKLPLYLCGSSYYGVGVNDVILSAKRAAENIK